MRKILYISLIVGFMAVDFLFFHDMFKAGESLTPAQYLTGILSIPIFIIAAQSLAKSTHSS